MVRRIYVVGRRWWSGIRSGVCVLYRAVFRRGEAESELEAELAFHLELEIEQKIREGLDPSSARRAALVAFGGVERFKEECRDARGTRFLEELSSDLRYAVRGLRRNPGFSIVAIVTLSLGIGANAGLFGLLNALLLRPPTGVPTTEGLVRIGNGDALSGLFARISVPDFQDLAEGVGDVLELAGATNTAGMALGSAGEPIRVRGQLVSGNYFSVLGVVTRLGRGFLPDEDLAAGGASVVVLGHDLWEREFGADPGVVGRSILLNGHGFTVVGVAPAGFFGLELEEPASLWVPLSAQPLALPRSYDPLTKRDAPEIRMIGKLRGEATTARAESALTIAAQRVETASPAKRFRPLRPLVAPMRGWVPMANMGGVAPLIGFAWVLTGLLLLVICANLANLLLARAISRRREIGIRLALGAGRGRLVRLLMAESLTLTSSAGLLGLLFAYWAAYWFQARFRGPLAPLAVTPVLATLGFTLAISVLTGLVFGLLPARRASRPEVVAALKGDDGGPIRHSRLQAMLVVTQIALSLVLLASGGILMRRLQSAGEARLGFDTEQILLATFDLSSLGYTPTARAQFYAELRERAARLSGVRAVTVPASVPLVGPISVEGIAPSAGAAGEETGAGGGGGLTAVQLPVAPDYFATLGIPVLRGRPIERRDLESATPVAVVSEGFARRHFNGEDPIGRGIFLQRNRSEDMRVEVVGVAADIAFDELGAEPRSHFYLPYTKSFEPFETTMALRAAGDPALVAPALRELLRGLDPNLPVFDLRTLEQVVEARLGTQRGLTGLVASFGALALSLAALGLYGLIAFTVAGRTREIGIRIALGAGEGQVTRYLLMDGARLVALGLAIGSLLALAVGRLIASAVSGTVAADPVTLIGVGVAMAAVALLATYLPARRGARVDPMVALRRE
jgi:predicted permease